jgi:hypothetical protein
VTWCAFVKEGRLSAFESARWVGVEHAVKVSLRCTSNFSGFETVATIVSLRNPAGPDNWCEYAVLAHGMLKFCNAN